MLQVRDLDSAPSIYCLSNDRCLPCNAELQLTADCASEMARPARTFALQISRPKEHPTIRQF